MTARATRALHVHLEGFTASYRHPLVLSGTQMSTPMPAYSNLLGMISSCAGRPLRPAETRVGFEFRCAFQDLEMERTVRFEMKRGALRPHSKGQGIVRRQVYWQPRLDLYVTNLALRSAFYRPTATPCFGRSQDIAWITSVTEVDLEPMESGVLGPTLLPQPARDVPGHMVRLPEWYENDREGYTRQPGPLGLYQAMLPTTDLLFQVSRPDLYHPSDAERPNKVIYLHEWIHE